MRDVAWEEASGRGRIFAFNVHRQAFRPEFNDDVPYVYAVIELEEGPLFPCNVLTATPGRLRVGQAVRVVFRHVEDGLVLPAFEPLDAEPGEAASRR